MLIVTVLNTQPENAADLILMVAFGIVTSASAVQPENALVPMLTTLAGNVTVASVVQPSNALSPITVTPLLKLISVSAVQPENALVSIDVTDEGMLIAVKPVQPRNALFPTVVIPFGSLQSVMLVSPENNSLGISDNADDNLMDETFVQPLKHKSPMESTRLPMLILSAAEQFSNALLPIDVTLFGIVIPSNDLTSLKVESSIFVREDGKKILLTFVVENAPEVICVTVLGISISDNFVHPAKVLLLIV